MRLENGFIIRYLTQFPLKFLLVFSLFYGGFGISQIESHIRKRTELGDGISPKSVVASGNGLFSAQNMMYRHYILQRARN
jgi:hypothetical protein